MEAQRDQVEGWKKNPWEKLPTWAKWTIGVVGAFILLGIGGAVGSSNESDLQDEVTALEGQLATANDERSQAEAASARLEGLRSKIVGEARDRASNILSGAKTESEEATEGLDSLKSEVASTEGELAEVEGSLSGAEQTEALSHFGEGIVQAELDFVPGTYKSAGGEGCYWALLNSASTNDIADNEFTTSAAQQIVTISTPYFQSTDCGTWERVGE